MEIKVGQWVRINNTISQLKELPNPRNIEFAQYNGWLVKVTNTPQELIEVGDLIKCKSNGYTHSSVIEVTRVDEYGIYTVGIVFAPESVIKILTPNSNGGYDLQWSKE